MVIQPYMAYGIKQDDKIVINGEQIKLCKKEFA
jgi:hypothetical protein